MPRWFVICISGLYILCLTTVDELLKHSKSIFSFRYLRIRTVYRVKVINVSLLYQYTNRLMLKSESFIETNAFRCNYEILLYDMLSFIHQLLIYKVNKLLSYLRRMIATRWGTNYYIWRLLVNVQPYTVAALKQRSVILRMTRQIICIPSTEERNLIKRQANSFVALSSNILKPCSWLLFAIVMRFD